MNEYDKGRLNLPFVGIPTFGKRPYVSDWDKIEAEIAIIGAPFDGGTQYRSGARFGPRAIREASTLFSFGHAGAYDYDDNKTYLDKTTRIIDMGDADIIHTDTEKSHRNIEFAVQCAKKAGALPVTLGGDHSINIPCINALEEFHKKIHILQIDAHLDFVDERHGVRYGHGNPMRRAAEKEYVMGMTQVGIRNVSSTSKEGYEDAISMGSTILTVRQFRALKLEDVLKKIPLEIPIYVTIDIDAFCPSIAPGTGTPSHGGFLYYEVLELLQKIALQRKIIGIDMVEVAPSYDPTEKTQILAAQILMNFLGFIFSK